MSLKRYLQIVVTGAGLMLAMITAINALVDPLWAFGGNRVTGHNFPFHERYAKTYHFLKHADQYDCLILGSSRTSLLDQRLIENHRCFNYAVAAARAPEQLIIARYAMQHMDNLRLVIVSVEEFQFWQDNYQTTLPPFLLKGDKPPLIWHEYASIPTLAWSLRTVANVKPFQRTYDRDLIAHTTNPERHHNEALDLEVIGYQWEVDPALADPYYAPFGDLGVRVVGYAPPRAARFTAYMEHKGTLDAYLDGLYAAAQHLDGLYDFSVPSAITGSAANNYDGSHFHADANRQVGLQLSQLVNGQAGQTVDALNVHMLTRAQLGQAYRNAITSVE